MEMIKQVTLNASLKLAKQWDDIILARLKEAGYDIVNPLQIAKRCTVIILQDSDQRQFWVDYGRDNAQLVATYTDPKVEMTLEDGVYMAKIEFTFSPLPTSESATVSATSKN